MKYFRNYFLLDVLALIAVCHYKFHETIEAISTFIRRKYYGYRYRTVEDAVRKVMNEH